MSSMPTAIRVAQTVGITASAYCAGCIFSISSISVPCILLAPNPVLTRQWQLGFDRGKIINPAIALASISSYVFLSFKLYGTLNHPKAEMYALAALATLGIWPWTVIGMMPTNRKLMKKNDEMKGLSVDDKATETGLANGESTKELVDRWGILNLGRSIFPLVGAVLGLWTTLN